MMVFVTEDGLWGLAFKPSASPDQLYCTAGPSYKSYGRFGYLKTE